MSEAEEIEALNDALQIPELMDVQAEDIDEPIAYTVTDRGSTDESHILSDMNLRLERIENMVDGLREGVNTIGTMMNQVAEVFDGLAEKVKSGGIGALLGGFMGGNKNG